MITDKQMFVAARHIRDALYALCPDNQAKAAVTQLWAEPHQDDRARLRVMLAALSDGVQYSNYPWTIGVRNR
jgi:hypothetical protein